MKTETTQITKLLISDLMGEPHKLDPVTVILEDIGHRVIPTASGSYTSRQGKIIVECYGKSWSAYWGGMGDRTVAQFFSDEHCGYLIGSLAPSLGVNRFSGGALVTMAKRVVLDCRRGRTANHHPYSMDKEDARKLFDRIEDELRNVEREDHCWNHSDLLAELFSDEWWHAASEATEPSPEYQYLQRIVQAVQAGLRQAGLANVQEVAA
ncbi:hypothetical protein RTH74_11685 [Pseudomonas sp. zfem001]|uniref:hypothetical protein n=1 Tax=Pseudomonas sp. zfem001 TaxID=3078196 RepID=UPI00292950CB|nr:hypothetical protein [Pseudomonas sp. zfem001]MDU9408260.1 hypothetical protein [Pseudomonas sp. zfem001]